MRLLQSLVLVLMAAVPSGVRAQACHGTPVFGGRGAADVRSTVASGWIGLGARGVVALSGTTFLALDGDILDGTDGKAQQLTGRVTAESAGAVRVCGFAAGSLFSRPVMDGDDTRGAARMNGRYGSAGAGVASLYVVRRVAIVPHASLEGAVMRRGRTGDGAVMYAIGAVAGVGRFRMGVLHGAATPYEPLLTRGRGSSGYYVIHAGVEFR